MAYINTSSVSTAVLRNDIHKLSSLIKDGKRIDIQDNLGYTPLHIAAKKLYTGCVNLLLQHPECPINEQDVQGCTSLYLACECRSPPIKLIRSLLEGGADPNIGNHEQIYPLHLACKNGNLDVVNILLDYNSDINVQDVDDDTPLHYAVDNRKQLVVHNLLKFNANTSLLNSYGLNPLMMSIVRKNEDIFNLLLPVTSNLCQQGARNETALSLAIQTGNINIIESLCNKDSIIIENSIDSFVGLDELYETDNFEIFQYIWPKLNHRLLHENAAFICTVTETLTIQDHLKQLIIIFQTKDLNLKLGNGGYILQNIFSMTDCPNKEYFTDKMDELVFITKSLLKYGGVINKEGFKAVCRFMKNCPHKEDLINIIMTNSDFQITEDLVVYGFSLNAEMGFLCLQYSSHLLNPLECFELLTKDSNSMEYLKFFTQFYSLNINITQQMLRITNNVSIQNMLSHFSGKVQSLAELCRNIIRDCVGRCLMQQKNVNVTDFQKAIKKLDCPLDTQDILLFKKPVNFFKQS